IDTCTGGEDRRRPSIPRPRAPVGPTGGRLALLHGPLGHSPPRPARASAAPPLPSSRPRRRPPLLCMLAGRLPLLRRALAARGPPTRPLLSGAAARAPRRAV